MHTSQKLDLQVIDFQDYMFKHILKTLYQNSQMKALQFIKSLIQHFCDHVLKVYQRPNVLIAYEVLKNVNIERYKLKNYI